VTTENPRACLIVNWKVCTFITTSRDIKFLDLIIENSLTWEGHVEELIRKLSAACYMFRHIKPLYLQTF
jgi:hypothetical protein